MGETEENVTVNVEGESAVQMMTRVSGAMNGIVASNQGLRSNFSTGFEHVGLHMFSRQLLETAGIAGESRPLIMGVSLALRAVGEAAGAAAGPIALIAIAGAAVVSAFKSMREAAAAEEEKIKGLTKSLVDFEEQQEKVSETGRRVAAIEMKNAEETQRETKRNLDGKLHAMQQLESGTAALHGRMEERVKAQSFGAEGARRIHEEFSEAISNAAKKEATLKEEVVLLSEEYKKQGEAVDRLRLLAQGNSDASIAATKKASDEERQSFKNRMDALQIQIGIEADYAKGEDARSASLLKAALAEEDLRRASEKRSASEEALSERTEKHEAKMFGVVAAAGSSAFGVLASASGNAFGKMIVESKTWSEAFKGIAQQVEEAFISMLVQMAIKYVAFTALTGGMFGAAGMSEAGANALVGSNFKLSAAGQDTYVDRPTLFMAGEAGSVEHVNITAQGGWQSSPASAQGGGTTIVQNISINAAGVVSDLNAFANMVAQKAAYAVRAQGQVAAVRPA